MNRRMRGMLTAVVAIGAATLLAGAGPVKVDSKLAEYKASQGVAGTIKSVGSDTMNNVMAHWNESFQKFYPGVKIEVEGKGSSTAPPALIQGQSQFGPMSREMKSSEIDEFEKKYGYKPTKLRVGIDALAVFVNKDNPLNEISLDQLKKVFSVAGPDMTWGELGVTDAKLKDQKVVLYGRNSASGTYQYFKEHALGKQDYKSTVKEQPGSSAVVQAVGTDTLGMGYSGIGYATADTKMLKVSTHGEKSVTPAYETALSGEYPLARFLYVYVNFDPTKALEPLRAEFIRFMYSKQGQEDVVKDGYFPVPEAVAKADLKTVGLSK